MNYSLMFSGTVIKVRKASTVIPQSADTITSKESLAATKYPDSEFFNVVQKCMSKLFKKFFLI